jgi:hypothetical protein
MLPEMLMLPFLLLPAIQQEVSKQHNTEQATLQKAKTFMLGTAEKIPLLGMVQLLDCGFRGKDLAAHQNPGFSLQFGKNLENHWVASLFRIRR